MRRRLSWVAAFALLAGTLVLVPSVLGSHAIVGPNVKVTDDNNNLDGGIGNVTPSKDAQNRQANETTVSISPLASPVTGQVDIVRDLLGVVRCHCHWLDPFPVEVGPLTGAELEQCAVVT